MKSNGSTIPRVALIENLGGGRVTARVRSFSDESGRYRIDLRDDGHVRCTCPDFTYRHAAHLPTIAEPQHLCKHVLAFAEQLAIEAGILEAA